MEARPAIVVYMLGWLASLGERGWRETPESDPAQGSLWLGNDAGERIEYSYRFNGGNARWFLFASPKRLRDQLDNVVPDGSRHRGR